MKKTEANKKVLIVNTVGMGYEGMSFVILNYLRNMSQEGLQLHITADPEVSDEFRQMLEKLGTVHIVPIKQDDLKGYLGGLCKILKEGVDVIHVHGNSGTMAMEAFVAKLFRVPKVIVHGHNTRTNHPVINAVLKYPMMLFADEWMACSQGAGKWLYNNRKFTVLNNAIDLTRFTFSREERLACRRELGIGDEFVVGHVGHFSEQKNHPFIVDVFAQLHRQNPNTRLLLVGGGPDYDDVVEQVNKLQLRDAVIFAGRRSDVHRLYQAMDVFLMPSRWEGLPLVLLEAQTSGLPVVASDRITREVQCAEHFWYLNIEDSPAVWAEKLQQLAQTPVERSADSAQPLRDHGFDIHLEAEKLRQIYLT